MPVLSPLQNTLLEGVETVGVGFIVMVNVLGDPEQVMPPLKYRGVTLIVATMAAVPVFTAVNDPIFPKPVAPIPIPELSFVQANPPPVIVCKKLIAPVGSLLHTTMFEGCAKSGTGFTITAWVVDAPIQEEVPAVATPI